MSENVQLIALCLVSYSKQPKINTNQEPSFGSDSSGFVKSVIGGLFSVFTSASTSASAGLSQQSASASTKTAGHASDSSFSKFKNKFGLKDEKDGDA